MFEVEVYARVSPPRGPEHLAGDADDGEDSSSRRIWLTRDLVSPSRLAVWLKCSTSARTRNTFEGRALAYRNTFDRVDDRRHEVYDELDVAPLVAPARVAEDPRPVAS